MNITKGHWRVNSDGLPYSGLVKIQANYIEVAQIKKPGRAKYYTLGQLPEEVQGNIKAIAQVPHMVKLLEAIEAYQKDGLNRWDWIQSEVNSVLAEIRGR